MDREPICLDSCFIIDFMNGDNSALEIYNKYSECAIYISDISIYEVSKGIILSRAEKFDKFLSLVGSVKVLPTTNLFAIESAEIAINLKKKGIIIDDNDCLIAGLMLRNSITKIITKNTKHFSKIEGITAIGY